MAHCTLEHRQRQAGGELLYTAYSCDIRVSSNFLRDGESVNKERKLQVDALRTQRSNSDNWRQEQVHAGPRFGADGRTSKRLAQRKSLMCVKRVPGVVDGDPLNTSVLGDEEGLHSLVSITRRRPRQNRPSSYRFTFYRIVDCSSKVLN